MTTCSLTVVHHSKHKLLRSLLHTDKPLNFVDVHKQNGHNDCGIFNIAYAVALCMGMHPGTLMFEQDLMRHLISCLQLFKFSTFPIKK